MITIIAAIGPYYEIGMQGGLCYHISEDMNYFKNTTMGHKVLMGKKTYESLPKRLEGREYYVATRDASDLPDWVHPVTDLKSFLLDCQKSDETIFVIGGGLIYEQALKYCNTMILTLVHRPCIGADTWFPTIDMSEWDADLIFSDCNIKTAIPYHRVIYRRRI